MRRGHNIVSLLLHLLPFFADVEPARECPVDKSNYHKWMRLGYTRFYVRTTPANSTIDDQWAHKFWSDGFEKTCPLLSKAAYLAIIPKLSTNAIIARHLERLAEKKTMRHFTFWIGAKTGNTWDGSYEWRYKQQENRSAIHFHNIFYRAPRKIGTVKETIKFVNESTETGMEDVHSAGEGAKDSDRCLAYALPFKNKPELGWQASWVERECNTPASSLCEMVEHDECNGNDPGYAMNPHVLTEEKDYYYYDGNWVFSNRRFIVNWKPRNKWEAEKYCADNGLKLFAPTLDDVCLIPYLKMWGIVLSTYMFWTSYTYDSRDMTFRSANGTVVQKGAKVANQYLTGRFESTTEHTTQVAYIWSYERRNETRCKEVNCKWMYYVLAPIQENMYLGTICQHEEADNRRPCDFEKAWNNDFTQALSPTAVIEFGYPGSAFWRSTYKQTFDSHICGDKDRQMIGVETDYWTIGGAPVTYKYDYLETYWVVDEELFQHVGKHEQLCTVSTLTADGDGYKRELTKVFCDEWHFYLCENIY